MSYEEIICKDGKRFYLTIDNLVEDNDTIYILTIYEIKKIFFFFKRNVKLLRTVAKESEQANVTAMIELGRSIIKRFTFN